MAEPFDPQAIDRKKQQDFDDFQNELAGREVGRQSRFGVGDGSGRALSDKEKREKAWRDTLDRLLMTDPEYRTLYVELGDRLRDAERDVDAEMVAIMGRLDALQSDVEDMRHRAAEVPGVGRVYRFADGRVLDENGVELDPVFAASIVWPDDAPTGEEYFGAMDELAVLEEQLGKWQDYRIDTLGGIRDRYDDRDNPMTKDDIRDALDEIQSLRPELSSITAPEVTEIPAMPEGAGAIAMPGTLK